MRIGLAALALTATACGARGTAPEAARPRAAPSPVRFTTDSAQYRVASYLAVQQEVGGQPQQSGLELVYFLSVQIARQGDRLGATLVLDSVSRYRGTAAVDPAAAASRAAVFQAILLPTGELHEFSGGDSTVRFVRELANELRQFFPRILANGAMPGQRWVDTTQQESTSSGVPLSIRSVGEHEVGEPDQHAGLAALPVRSRISYTFSGTGTQAGQEFRVEGTGRRHVVEYLALTGRYLGLTATDSSSFTITLSAAGITIPGRQTRADTVSVIR